MYIHSTEAKNERIRIAKENNLVKKNQEISDETKKELIKDLLKQKPPIQKMDGWVLTRK